MLRVWKLLVEFKKVGEEREKEMSIR